jgi:hypothetical protein
MAVHAQRFMVSPVHFSFLSPTHVGERNCEPVHHQNPPLSWRKRHLKVVAFTSAPGFLVIALTLLIWHTDLTFQSRDKADSFADRGSGETLNKHKGLS